MTTNSIINLTATELAQKIKVGDLSALKFTEAFIQQIEKVNP